MALEPDRIPPPDFQDGAFRDGSSLSMALLGVATGLVAGALILLFRLVVDSALIQLLPEHSENFEGLSPLLRSALPLTAVGLLILLCYRLPPEARRTGVVQVLERLHFQGSRLGLRDLCVQFVGAALVLIGGLSMGREGPAVHLGATTGSLLGQRAQQTEADVRLLAGCGCAAAIAATFNTPIAGVLFALEVLLLDYRITSLIPMMLAAATGAALTRLTHGNEIAFLGVPLQLESLLEIPLVLGCAVLTGIAATLLIRLTRLFTEGTAPIAFSWRFLLAGVITALCGWIAPEILGLGYDSIRAALSGSMLVGTMLLILNLKIVATSACVGSGLPGGVIGPTLLIGAMTGGLCGNFAATILPDDVADVRLYVLLGMAGMMSATLRAPMATLMTLLELSFNPGVIFPGMLVVVTANLVTERLFHQPGIFQMLLAARGLMLPR